METGYQHELDYSRLKKQVEKVAAFMSDGEWYTLEEISKATGAPQASVSARLRGLRAVGNRVDRRRVGDPKQGLWAYRVVPMGALTAQMVDAALNPKPIYHWDAI